MASLNTNIPAFKCLVAKKSFTKDNTEGYYNACAFAIQSVTGKILTFHVVTDFGALRSRVPISDIYLKHPTKDVPIDFKQLWDCFSENVSVCAYDWLFGKRCRVTMKDRADTIAAYMFTVDWYDNPYSNDPRDYKSAHILAADDGYLLAQPNNRIWWECPNFITADIPSERFKVDTELLSVENMGPRWRSEDTDDFEYKIKNLK